jgi:hypothetical protein
MKSNRWILITIAAVVIVWAVKGYAGNMQMTTFYPAPTGFYDQLKVNSKFIIPCFSSLSATGMPNNAIWISDGTCPAQP